MVSYQKEENKKEFPATKQRFSIRASDCERIPHWPSARVTVPEPTIGVTFGLVVQLLRRVPAVDDGGAGPTQSFAAQLREHGAKEKEAAEGRARPIDDGQSSP